MVTKFLLSSLCASLLGLAGLALASAQDEGQAQPQTEAPNQSPNNAPGNTPELTSPRSSNNSVNPLNMPVVPAVPAVVQPGNRDSSNLEQAVGAATSGAQSPSVRVPGTVPSASVATEANIHWTLGIQAERVPQWLVMHLPQFFGDANPQAQRFGLLVTKVAPQSPAALAQLEPGDLILAVDDSKIAAPEQLQPPLRKAAGQPVMLTLVRRGQLLSSQIQAQGTPMPPTRASTNVVGATAINIVTPQGTISITGSNDNFQLRGSYLDMTGLRVPLNLNGSLADVVAEVQRLPESLQNVVMSRLPNAARLPK